MYLLMTGSARAITELYQVISSWSGIFYKECRGKCSAAAVVVVVEQAAAPTA